jgi:hypothetical protein
MAHFNKRNWALPVLQIPIYYYEIGAVKKSIHVNINP